MSVREDIKILLTKENITLTELAKEISIKTNKKITMDSLSQKLRRSSMKYDEVKLLVESIGYKIEFVKEKI
jgi:hypothetical protein